MSTIDRAALMVALKREFLAAHPGWKHWSTMRRSYATSPERLFVYAKQRWGITFMVEVARHLTVTEADVEAARRDLTYDGKERQASSKRRRLAEVDA